MGKDVNEMPMSMQQPITRKNGTIYSLYILWMYWKSNNGKITAVLNEARLLTGNSETLGKIAWAMCGTSILRGFLRKGEKNACVGDDTPGAALDYGRGLTP